MLEVQILVPYSRPTILRVGRPAKDGEKIFAKATFDKGLFPEYTKNFKNSTIRKKIQPDLKMGQRP